ncbi:MAG: serine/threonine protein kinase [Crenarchaeota archaeon]|nr:serine/threonine protein kinase [Thermoproteota archaeon]
MRIGELILAILLLILVASLISSLFPVPPFPMFHDFLSILIAAFEAFIILVAIFLIISYVVNLSRTTNRRNNDVKNIQNVNNVRRNVNTRVEEIRNMPSIYGVQVLEKIVRERISYYVPARVRGRALKIRRNIPGLKVRLEGATCYPVGEGAVSRVYLCVTDDGRRYALKVPKTLNVESISEDASATIDDVVINKFVREIEVLKKLNHPCIIKLIDFSATIPVLLYEFADGLSLSYQISNGWKPTLRDVLIVLIQVTDAIRYVHSRGIVHGDLKLGNILICDGIAKICDFSTVRDLLSSSSSMSISCTRGYCAPEQLMYDLRRKSAELGLEYKIDIYQLGNIALALLIGETIDGEERIKMMEFEVLKKVSKIEPVELRELIVRMLDIDPLKRPNAEEVLKSLVNIYVKRFGVS